MSQDSHPSSPVRAATSADAPGIGRVHVTSWQSAYRGLLPAPYLAGLSAVRSGQRWRAYLTEGRAAFVAEDTRGIIGFVTAGASRDEDGDEVTGEIYALYVVPRHWRRGAGLRLQTRALDYLVNAGFSRATLWVLDTNERARRFYERTGWAADGKRKTQLRDGIPCPESRYSRPLP